MRMKSKSSTTTKRAKRLAPLHPGEMLREEFMVPLGLSANAVALAVRVPTTRITEILNGRRGITADTALRLARLFRMTPEYWMGLQIDYDLDVAMDQIEEDIDRDIHPLPIDEATGSLKAA
ncbi:HigA family addiction module antitoxin [Granulicella mallensis]|jgi:addiction module HigA family antidote|nr:HigA family addiction module antitoxin [Granulicella mallensis]